MARQSIDIRDLITDAVAMRQRRSEFATDRVEEMQLEMRLRVDKRRRDPQSRGRWHDYSQYKKDKCERCGFVPIDPVQLDVHHADRNHCNGTPSNLVTLCANCHRLQLIGLLQEEFYRQRRNEVHCLQGAVGYGCELPFLTRLEADTQPFTCVPKIGS